MMKVENGEVFYGSKDIDEDGGYFSNNALERNFVVKDVSTGKRSFKFSVSNRIKEVSQDEADQKIATLGITANDYVINPLVSDTLIMLSQKLTLTKILKTTTHLMSLLTVISKNFNRSITKNGL